MGEKGDKQVYPRRPSSWKNGRVGVMRHGKNSKAENKPFGLTQRISVSNGKVQLQPAFKTFIMLQICFICYTAQ